MTPTARNTHLVSVQVERVVSVVQVVNDELDHVRLVDGRDQLRVRERRRAVRYALVRAEREERRRALQRLPGLYPIPLVNRQS